MSALCFAFTHMDSCLQKLGRICGVFFRKIIADPLQSDFQLTNFPRLCIRNPSLNSSSMIRIVPRVGLEEIKLSVFKIMIFYESQLAVDKVITVKNGSFYWTAV